MGQGYGRYWLTRLAIGLPIVGFGLWRLVKYSKTLPDDEQVGYWMRSAATLAAVVVAVAVAIVWISVPYMRAVRSARRRGSLAFVARRTPDLVQGLDQYEKRSWNYWVLVEVSDHALEIKAKPFDETSGISIPRTAVAGARPSTARLGGIDAPSLEVEIAGGPALKLAPSNSPFGYTWGVDKIEDAISRLRADVPG